MKKLLLAVAMALVCLLGVGQIVQAAMVDLGFDDLEEQWYGEYLGTDVSKDGITYEVVACYIKLTDAGRKFWRNERRDIGPEVHYLGLLRVIDCKGNRYGHISEAFYSADGEQIKVTTVKDDWEWRQIPTTTETMMGRAAKVFCRIR